MTAITRRLTAFATSVFLASCSGGGGGDSTAPPPPPAQATSVRLDLTSVMMARGQPVSLVATPLDASGNAIAGKTMSWTSNDPSIVAVATNGTITGGNAGSTTVTASVDGKSAGASVTVIAFSSIQPGPAYSCAITVAGRLYCAGGNYGTLAKPEGDALRFSAVSLNGEPPTSPVNHGCAISVDGDAYCWGSNSSGALGTGDVKDRPTPTPVAGGLKFTQITSGRAHTCSLIGNGDAYCWGDNTIKELGANTTETCIGGKPCSHVPLAVETNLRFTSIASSQYAMCAITSAPQNFCWGGDEQHVFGAATPPAGCDVSGFMFGCTISPTAGPTGFTSIAGSARNFCGVNADGIAYCWGGNDLGQLGFPGIVDTAVPKPFSIDPSSS